MARRKAGLLVTESKREFSSLRKAIEDEIGPMGAIERIYVDDFIALSWETSRYRRMKAELINRALLRAAETVLKQVLRKHEFETPLDRDRAAEHYAECWLRSEEGKAEALELLSQFDLDEGAIEAEAFRCHADDIERIDRMIALTSARRDRVLEIIATIRGELGKLLRQAGDRIIEHENVLQVVERVSIAR